MHNVYHTVCAWRHESAGSHTISSMHVLRESSLIHFGTKCTAGLYIQSSSKKPAKHLRVPQDSACQQVQLKCVFKLYVHWCACYVSSQAVLNCPCISADHAELGDKLKTSNRALDTNSYMLTPACRACAFVYHFGILNSPSQVWLPSVLVNPFR